MAILTYVGPYGLTESGVFNPAVVYSNVHCISLCYCFYRVVRVSALKLNVYFGTS